MTTTPVMSITDEQIAEIESLAKAAPHQTWRAGNAYKKAFILNYQVIADTPDGAYVLMEGNNNFPKDSVANVAYVGSAQPSVILALISRLRDAEAKARMTIGVGDGSGNLFVHGDYDSIKAVQSIILENEKLRKDAGRYRFLKDQGHFRAMSMDMGGNHSWTGMGRIVGKGPTVDDAIDAAMTGEKP